MTTTGSVVFIGDDGNKHRNITSKPVMYFTWLHYDHTYATCTYGCFSWHRQATNQHDITVCVSEVVGSNPCPINV